MPRSKGRSGRPYRRPRDQIRAISRVCWICGYAIDFALPPRHPLSWTLDHLMPLSKGGDPLDPANARAAHYRCNSRRGNRLRARKPTTSRHW